MKPQDWIPGMLVKQGGVTLTLLYMRGGHWHYRTSMGVKSSGEVGLWEGWGARPQTYEDLGRKPEVGGLAVVVEHWPYGPRVGSVMRRDILRAVGEHRWFDADKTNERNGYTQAELSCLAPLDAEVYRASQAETVEAGGAQFYRCDTCGHEFGKESVMESTATGTLRCRTCLKKNHRETTKTTPLCDDGRDAQDWCLCDGLDDCIHCLARAEESEAWDLHTVWLEAHAPAGDVSRREAEDAAEASRKRERDEWMGGLR